MRSSLVPMLSIFALGLNSCALVWADDVAGGPLAPQAATVGKRVQPVVNLLLTTDSDDVAAVPTISAATLLAGTISVGGKGFGTRTQAAPVWFEDFDSRSIGAAPASFGYTNYGSDSGGTVSVDGATGFSGSRSLRHQTNFGSPSVNGDDIRESFPHIGMRGFSSTELYISYRVKFATNGSRVKQLKFNRGGMERVDPNGGSPCYAARPKFRSSYYAEEGTYDMPNQRLESVQGGIERENGTVVESWVGEAPTEVAPYVILPNTWVQVEEYYRLNDIGASNGEFVTYVNGHRNFNRPNLQMRTNASTKLNCSYLVIGIDYFITPTSTSGVSVWYDDHYLDTSRARLVLANASTWAASTMRSPQPATQWSGNAVTAQLKRGGFGAGNAWLYLVRADGVVSNGWKVVLP
ncbi:MAG: hypothetical protein V4805_17405 [Pseudomonadota bacterium]